MIGRIHERSIFARLRREGSFVRSGPLWCSVLLDPTLSRPHVAYALGRPLGSAVARNRLRRRMREIVAVQESSMAPGWYLFGADASALTMTFAQLSEAVPALAGRAASRNRSRQDGAR